MTKEQFLNKWPYLNDTRDTINPYFIDDLEAVIANEIAKVQEVNEIKKNLYFHKQVMNPHETGSQSYTAYENGFIEGYNKCHEIEKAKEQPQLNPIAEAYARGEKVRPKKWDKGHWIKKYDNLHWIHSNGVVQVTTISLFENPQNWELYTEPAEQVANPFDRDRFEAMFRAVVASGKCNTHIEITNTTEKALKQLDAYYASKEGGNNG